MPRERGNGDSDVSGDVGIGDGEGVELEVRDEFGSVYFISFYKVSKVYSEWGFVTV